MDEAGWKRKIIKEINDAGGYAIRIEDKHAVGRLDTLIVVPGALVVFAVEFKMIRGKSFGPTPRQFAEGMRIRNRGYPLVPMLIGITPDGYIVVAEWTDNVFLEHKTSYVDCTTDIKDVAAILRRVGGQHAGQ